MVEQLVLKIYGSSFSANLSFSNDKLTTFSIDYNVESGKFTISGADIVISIGNYHYMPEKKEILSDFNETVMEKYKEKITVWKINESEAKQLLLDLLDYINGLTKGEANELIEKVKNAVKSENVEVKFSSELSGFSSEYSTIYKEAEGINKLRVGSLLLVIASIFFTLAFFVLLTPVLFPLMTVSYHPIAIVGTAIDFIIVEAIGALAGYIALLNVRKGFEILNNLGKDVGIGYTGTILAFIALALLILGLSLAFIGVGALLIISYAIGIISDVLIGIEFYKLGEIYNEGMTKIGGILVIIIPFVGYILTYSGLGKIITKIMLPTPPAKPE